jgi:hypothetical protein
MQKIRASDLAESRRVHAAGEKLAVHIRKGVGPSRDAGARPVLALGVHGAKQFADYLMSVGRVLGAHPRDGVGEQPDAVENVGVLSEEAEDQPRHKVVHVVTARGGVPFGIVFQKLDIQPVHAARGANVERAFANLLDGSDPGQRQEETEVIGEVGIGTGDRLARC